MQPASSQLKLLYAQTLEQAEKRDLAVTVYRSLLDQDATRCKWPAARDASACCSQRRSMPAAIGTARAMHWRMQLFSIPRTAQILNYLGYSLLERRIDVASRVRPCLEGASTRATICRDHRLAGLGAISLKAKRR
jgi:hypothetical protein